MKAGLSIIIPFAGEYPQVLFTIQATAQIFLDRGFPFEIIAVNNYCDQLVGQARRIAGKKMLEFLKGTEQEGCIESFTPEDILDLVKAIPPVWEDRSGAAIKASAGKNPWLKYVEYKDKLSHWQAKRVGVEQSEYDTLLFLDAHVVPTPTLAAMFYQYRYDKAHGFSNGTGLSRNISPYFWDIGTMHMPLTYKILEWRKIIYKIVFEAPHFWTYSFTGFKNCSTPYEVPCMSTCGMMISRHIYDAVGGWPKSLGIYGGGENFMNYTLAVCGYKKFIYPHATLFHHGERRDYHYEYDDTLYNRMLAHYLFGGTKWLELFARHSKGNRNAIDIMKMNIMDMEKEHRDKIASIQKYDIEEWADDWIKQ